MKKLLLTLIIAISSAFIVDATVVFRIDSSKQDGQHKNLTGDEVNTYTLRPNGDYTPWFADWTSAPDCFGISVNFKQTMTTGARFREAVNGIGLWTTTSECTYNLTLPTGLTDYYVTGYSYTATATAAGQQLNGEEIPTTGKHYEVTNLPKSDSFSLAFTTKSASGSARIDLTDFTLTLENRHSGSITYRIDSADINNCYNKSHNVIANTMWFTYWEPKVDANGVQAKFTRTCEVADSPIRQIYDRTVSYGIGINAIDEEMTFKLSLLSGETDYYVSAYSFNAHTAASGVEATLNGTTITNTAVNFSQKYAESDTPFELNFATRRSGSTNTCIDLTDFTLTLTPRNSKQGYEPIYNKVASLIADAILDADKYAGEGVGKYTEGLKWKNSLTAAQVALQTAWSTEYFQGAEFEAACQAAIDAIEGRPAINEVLPGQYVRIKSNQTGQYVHFGSDKATSQNANGDDAILFYDENHHLSGFVNGAIAIPETRYFGTSMTSAAQNADAVRAANASAWAVTFAPAGNSEIGCYNVRYSTNAHLYHAAHLGNALGAFTYASIPGRDGFDWQIEPVTELPVAIHSDGFGSLVCGAPVSVPSNLGDATVYVDTNTGNTFAQVEAGQIIAPYTPIYVYAPGADTVNLKVEPAAEAYDYASQSAVGSTLTKEIVAEAGKSYYAKLPYSPKQTQVRREPREAAAPLITMVKLEPINGIITIPAATAVMTTNNEGDNAPATIQVNPNDLGTTAISKINADMTTPAIYDLQGRKLAAPSRGINIINGRKILSK